MLYDEFFFNQSPPSNIKGGGYSALRGMRMISIANGELDVGYYLLGELELV
jgi:hypothetical protein